MLPLQMPLERTPLRLKVRRSRATRWPRTRSTTTSAAATTARRSWLRFSVRGRCGRRHNGLRCSGFRLRFRCTTRLDYWSFRGDVAQCCGWSGGWRGRLIVVEPRLQWFWRRGIACFLGGTGSRLLAALQALAHPFAHIAACSTPARVEQSASGGGEDTPGEGSGDRAIGHLAIKFKGL